MSFVRRLSPMLVPFLGGCLINSEPPPVDYSPGFFSDFERMVNTTNAQTSVDTKAATFTTEFDYRVKQGPSEYELYAAGPTWDKVRAFLDIGLLSSEIMASVNDSAQSRVDIYADAADWVLRSDYLAITSWNQNVSSDKMIRPTADIVWESLHLVLTESAHAEMKIPTTKGEWVAGHWTRTAKQSRDLWVKGYYETVWRDGSCHDEFVATECSSVWVPETCTDEWIDDGYWESTCSAYDDDGNCTEWTDTWVDTGYYESQCVDSHYEDQCTDVYQTVCVSGRWEDIWISSHTVEGATIPGELAWVEEHQAPETKERVEVLPEQEAAILALGIEYVLSFGPEYLLNTCASKLEEARTAYDTQAAEDSIRSSREAILHCLSQQ